MKDNRSKDEIVRILQQQHAIPVYLTMKGKVIYFTLPSLMVWAKRVFQSFDLCVFVAWDQIEIESPGFFEEYFVQTLLNPDAESEQRKQTNKQKPYSFLATQVSFLCFFLFGQRLIKDLLNSHQLVSSLKYYYSNLYISRECSYCIYCFIIS